VFSPEDFFFQLCFSLYRGSEGVVEARKRDHAEAGFDDLTPTLADKRVKITGSIDAGWQTRGTQRSYNSLSGALLISYFVVELNAWNF